MEGIMNKLHAKIAQELYNSLGDYVQIDNLDEIPNIVFHNYYIVGTNAAKQFCIENFGPLMRSLHKYSEDTGLPYPGMDNYEDLATFIAREIALTLLHTLDHDYSGMELNEYEIDGIRKDLKVKLDIHKEELILQYNDIIENHSFKKMNPKSDVDISTMENIIDRVTKIFKSK